MAKDLHLSEATVKSHLIHIFDKLGVADRVAGRTAAVTVALEKASYACKVRNPEVTGLGKVRAPVQRPEVLRTQSL